MGKGDKINILQKGDHSRDNADSQIMDHNAEVPPSN